MKLGIGCLFLASVTCTWFFSFQEGTGLGYIFFLKKSTYIQCSKFIISSLLETFHLYAVKREHSHRVSTDTEVVKISISKRKCNLRVTSSECILKTIKANSRRVEVVSPSRFAFRSGGQKITRYPMITTTLFQRLLLEKISRK